MTERDDHGREAAQFGDQEMTRGAGGEVHRTVSDDGQALTTNKGASISDDQNTLRAGARGPTLMKDFHFRQKILHFHHERIPEQAVHARGTGAHGFLETYESLSDVTRADLFRRKAERTEAFMRFSTMVDGVPRPVTGSMTASPEGSGRKRFWGMPVRTSTSCMDWAAAPHRCCTTAKE